MPGLKVERLDGDMLRKRSRLMCQVESMLLIKGGGASFKYVHAEEVGRLSQKGDIWEVA